MNAHCVYLNASGVRFLGQIKFLKWRSAPVAYFLHRRGMLKDFSSSQTSRILYINPKVQNTVSTSLQVHEVKELSDFLYKECFIKENWKTNEEQVLLTIDCQHIKEFLWMQEFKDILTRTSFLYDISLPCPAKEFSDHKHCLVDLENYLLSNSSDEKDSEVKKSSETAEIRTGKPTEDQLLNIIDKLTHSLVNFFEKPHEFSIYHKDIEFQNNIKGIRTKGIRAYIHNMYLMKLYGIFQYARVKVEVLKVTHHLDDGTVRVRWRVVGVSRHGVLNSLLKLRTIDWQKLQEKAEWLDGFSVFSVGYDGLIYKHVCDKMIPDDERSVVKPINLKTQLLQLLGLRTGTTATGGLHLVFLNQKAQDSIKKFT